MSTHAKRSCDLTADGRMVLNPCRHYEALKAQNAELLAALRPFARFLEVHSQLGGTTPHAGPLYQVISGVAGEASIDAEHLEAARDQLIKAGVA
jgi:hypothetical protein